MCLWAAIYTDSGAEMPTETTYTNSIGMEFVRIEPGTFSMGSEEGHFDEAPVHDVTITQPFYLGKYEVTNADYDLFDPGHASIDHRGFTRGGDEAVIFVSWEDANAFCGWMSGLEGLPYRLATEAEWEHACRAGTTSWYHTGNSLPSQYQKNPGEEWSPDPTDLTVGQSPANGWGLFDMHGNVEEWTNDWYGPYEDGGQTDPVGRASGDFKVTRGGSHSTTDSYLRSANRLGTLPSDRHWMIGFRVVLAAMPATAPLPPPPPELFQSGVDQNVPPDIEQGPDPNKPYFEGPVRYVKVPSGSDGPLFSNHNHQPAICVCPNGDLFAIWYSTIREAGRELGVAASRLRYGTSSWDNASPFWDTPDRNDHGNAIWNDGNGKLYQFNGLAEAATWGSLAMIMRTSSDNGVTWSPARLIDPVHGSNSQVIAGAFRTSEGYIIVASDAVTGSSGGSALHISRDEGLTWLDPSTGSGDPDFVAGGTGGWIAGIHTGVAQLDDGRLLAYGRGDNIEDQMPISISDDMAESWTYWPSGFPPVSGGQRLVLLRLKEGPLLLVSFTGADSSGGDGLVLNDATGRENRVYGMFGAVSFDQGRTWPAKRLLSPGGGPTIYDGGGNTGTFLADDTHAEPKGYLAVTQAPDGVVHLISSALHYRFNLAYLMQGFYVVEDFESYAYNHQVNQYWADGAVNGSNMTIFKDSHPKSGHLNLQCNYDNDSPPYYSQADLLLEDPLDMTLADREILSLWLAGRGGLGRLYVQLTDATGATAEVDHPEPETFIDSGGWHRWDIDLAQFQSAGVDISSVRRLAAGTAEGGAGYLLLDDIKLYPRICLYEQRQSGDFDADCTVGPSDLAILAGDWLATGIHIQAAEPDTGRMMLHYRLDETSGFDVADSSGRGNHGSIYMNSGTPEWIPDGRRAGCLSFSDDTAIDVPTDALSGIDRDVTVCVWLNGSGPAGRDNVILDTGSGGTFLRIDVPDDGGRVYFRAGSSDEAVIWADLRDEDWRDQWNHWAFVRDGVAETLRIYRNCQLKAEETGASGSLASLPGNIFDIGATIPHSNDYNGLMDDLRIYSYALSQAEIAGAAGDEQSLHIPVDSPADIDADDRVEFDDFAIFAADWLRSGLWP